jgi:NTE family protein
MDSDVMVEALRRRKASAPAPTRTRTVNLALQDGGAHGAFSWGVLDRLLEDDRIGFDGISATSAAVLAYGYALGDSTPR